MSLWELKKACSIDKFFFVKAIGTSVIFKSISWHILSMANSFSLFWQFAGVFYCGAPALTKELKQHALDFSHKTSTKFDFHKENFWSIKEFLKTATDTKLFF